MRLLVRLLYAAGLVFLCVRPAFGQRVSVPSREAPSHLDEEGDDPRVIAEIGAASSWDTRGGATTFAPNLAAETTPIEHVLELELGVSPFFTRSATEWDTDLLFKKPWTLSPKAEFMLGVGPEWVSLRRSGRTSNTVAGEIAGDFMFWPNGRHHFGWFLEPAYDVSFAAGHPQSVGMSAGLLVGLARRRH